MLVATTLATLSQANILNISLLNEIKTEVELEKKKLHDEITSLKTEMKKRKKVAQSFDSIQRKNLGRTRAFTWWKSWMFCKGTEDGRYNKSFRKASRECISSLSEWGILADKDWGTRKMEKYREPCSMWYSNFEEKVKQSVAGIMKVCTKNVQDM